jgi:hypothetical protein
VDERVTWEICPTCGRRAAVGWELSDFDADHSVSESPIEFDCPAGCMLPATELDRVFTPSRHRGW